LKKTLSVIAIAILALSFSISANAVTKKGDGVTAAGVGMHQPKKSCLSEAAAHYLRSPLQDVRGLLT
jgi:hypothetical protein